jgi:hypothetical protein
MTITFRPAVRAEVALLVGLAGSSGSGKTFSAMRLASGIAGERRFAFIDTEARRGLHYADQFAFDHADLTPPFTPDRYAEAIKAADDAGYPVIVVDSISHVWAGEGGVLDWQDAELDRMAGDDWKKREAVKMAAWIKPKMAHKAMVQRLLQVRAHLILCFRAEEKIEMIRGDDGKMKIIPKVTATGLDGWVPVTEKNLPYELTASFLLMASKPGVPHPIKLQEQHRLVFPLDKPITEASGKLIAEWAAGGKRPEPMSTGTGALGGSGTRFTLTEPTPPADRFLKDDQPRATITDMQAADLESACSEIGASVQSLKKAAGVAALTEIKIADYDRALHWIAEAKARREGAKP